MTRKEKVVTHNLKALSNMSGGGVENCPDEYLCPKLTKEGMMKSCIELNCNNCWNKEESE